jgi:L-ascorbate metabolism protein UlaG (beta-lactamase superfamily)
LDWLGCATFRLTVDELVVFLDAYIDRVPGAEGPGIACEDIDQANWILVGHSHFDHLWGAERIALRTGATIVGSFETVRVMEAQGVPASQLIPVAGGERLRLGRDVIVSVLPSLHSCVWTHKQLPASDEVCIGDLGVLYDERMQRYGEMMGWIEALSVPVGEHMTRSNQGARGNGGSLLFLLETPHGSLLFQDTAGHWSGIVRGLRPDVAILAAAGRGNVDGEPVQGTLAEFLGRQTALLEPRRVILGHHDNWLPGFSAVTDVTPIRSEIARQAPPAELVEIGYLNGYPLFEGLRKQGFARRPSD